MSGRAKGCELGKLLGSIAAVLFLWCNIENTDSQWLEKMTFNSVSREAATISFGAEFRDYRVLAFGTSRTWGSQLNDRFKEAYPWLLAPRATNLAHRATGPSLPAMCLYEMVGDEIYDIILIEFNFNADQFLVRLVHRLRNRFPAATFIFLKMWSMQQFHSKSKGLSFMEIQRSAFFDSNRTLDFATFKQQIGDFDPDDIVYNPHYHDEHLLDEAIKITNGLVVEPWVYADASPKQYLLDFAWIFVDGSHYSKKGHEVIHNMIVAELMNAGAKKSDNVNPWRSKDHCENWFESGELSPGSIPHDPKLIMNEFQPSKHALELRPPFKDTWFMVSNPSNGPAELFISYMSMGPELTKYPVMQISVNGIPRVELVPAIGNCSFYTSQVHIQEMMFLGRVGAGEANISMREIKPGTEPLRIVGFVVTPADQDKTIVGTVSSRY